MKAMKWVMGVLLMGTLTVQADDAAFWRVSSAGTAVVTTIDMNGTLAWSNSVQGNNEQVQRATILAPIADWQDYVLVPVTSATASVKAFELNPPRGMVLIPAGRFVMGATTNVGHENYPGELPQHAVYVSAFYMDRHEVTQVLWDEVKTWADTNDYIFQNVGSGKATNHPVHSVNWHDAVKWCNARSEKDSLTPCYTTNGITYKTGSNDNVVCNWSANGYRLPTEAEWEKAARGGVANMRFPWTDYTNKISHAKANYYGVSGSYSYDLSNGYHPAYTNGGEPYSSPVGSFAPNGYSLYDMAGNMMEWVWDWYDNGYYSSSPSTDPRGPASSPYSVRVLRGGVWGGNADYTRCAYRHVYYPDDENYYFGFRCARGL
jgi:sulfatase modifying factor 1